MKLSDTEQSEFALLDDIPDCDDYSGPYSLTVNSFLEQVKYGALTPEDGVGFGVCADGLESEHSIWQQLEACGVTGVRAMYDSVKWYNK